MRDHRRLLLLPRSSASSSSIAGGGSLLLLLLLRRGPPPPATTTELLGARSRARMLIGVCCVIIHASTRNQSFRAVINQGPPLLSSSCVAVVQSSPDVLSLVAPVSVTYLLRALLAPRALAQDEQHRHVQPVRGEPAESPPSLHQRGPRAGGRVTGRSHESYKEQLSERRQLSARQIEV